jgi:uncharacterized protein GlcG (DUF336 family)
MSTRTDTGVLVERAKTTPPSQFILKVPHMLLLQGGIVIKIGDETVGALGVSGAPGGEKDEACARAALDKVSGQLKYKFSRRRQQPDGLDGCCGSRPFL